MKSTASLQMDIFAFVLQRVDAGHRPTESDITSRFGAVGRIAIDRLIGRQKLMRRGPDGSITLGPKAFPRPEELTS
jgi:hypothetical protein